MTETPGLQPLKTYTAQPTGSVREGSPLGVLGNTPPQGAKKQAQYIAKASVTNLTMGALLDPGHCAVESPSGYSGSPVDGTFTLNPPNAPAAQNYPRWVVDVDNPSAPGSIYPPDGTPPPPPLPFIGSINITGGGSFQIGDAITLTATRSGNASVTWGWTPPAGSLVTPSTTNVQSIPAAAETDTGTWTATATEAEETSDGPSRSGTEQVTVTAAPLPTIGAVTVTGPATAEVGDSVTLTAARDGDATVTWAWTVPAGSAVTPSTTATQSIPSAAEADTGTWTATATASEPVEGPTSGSGDHVLTVSPLPPLPTIGTVDIAGGGVFTVGDEVTLTATRSGNAVVTWSWTPPAGSLVTPSTTNVQSIPAAAETDTGTWTAVATEGEETSDGPTKSGTESLTVNAAPPLPTIGTVTVTGGGTYTVGDEVTLTASISGDAADVVWSWAAPAGSGQTPPGDSATWTFTSADNDDGTWTATATSATASDSPQNGTASLTVDPPVGGYDPDAQDYIDRVELADGEPLEDEVKDAINQLFLDLKAIANVWSNIGAFYPLSGPRTVEGVALTAYPTSAPDLSNQSVTAGDYDRLGVFGNRVDKAFSMMVDADWREGTSPWLGIRTEPGRIGDEAGVKIGAIKDGSSFWMNNGSLDSSAVIRCRSTNAGNVDLPGKDTQMVLGGATQTTGSGGMRMASASVDVECAQSNVFLPVSTSNLGIMGRLSEGAFNAFSGSKHSCVIYMRNYPGSMEGVRSICQAFDNYHATISAVLPPPGGYDPDAQDYITRVETADGEALENAVKDVINQLFLDLKAIDSGAIYSSLHTCYLYDAARSMAGARESLFAANELMGLDNLVESDYVRGSGLSGDGSSKYGTTFNNCDFTQHYCMGAYSGNDGTTDPCMLGALSLDNANYFSHAQAPGNVNFRASQSGSTVATGFYAQDEMIMGTSSVGIGDNTYIKAATTTSVERTAALVSSGQVPFGIHGRVLAAGGANAYSFGPIKSVVVLNDNNQAPAALQEVCVAFNAYHAAISAALSS